MPRVWEAPKPAELVAAETRLDELRAEQAALRSGYEAAMAGEDMARVTELRVRGDILPALLEAAERMMLERRRNWLEASRGLLVPHTHRLSDELDARQEQRDRLDVELDQLRHALAELKGPAMAIAEELGRINRRLAPPIPLTGRLLAAGERVVS